MNIEAIVCDHSYWIYSNKGGIVDVLPNLADKVKRGDIIAIVYDVFGQVKEQVLADKNGVVIGKNINPSCDAGTRVLHLGVDEIEPRTVNIPGHDDFEDN
jgi:predicted deacylase